MENREPIFHDRQFVVDQLAHTTSSLVFVDVPNATFTTKDLGSPSNYTFQFSPVISATQANTLVSFQVLVDGSPASPMARVVLLKLNNADLGVTFSGIGTGIEAGDVIQVQWKTDKGTVTLSEYDLLIDGIPEIRVIE